MIQNYATQKEKDPQGTTEVTYLSSLMRLGLLNYETSLDDAAILIVGDLYIETSSRMKLMEFANLLEAFKLGFLEENESLECFGCISLQKNISCLKLEISYVKKIGGQPYKKEFELSKAECHSLSLNICRVISESSKQGKTLTIDA